MQDSPRSADPMLKAYLETRRSVPALRLSEPGPSQQEIESILKIASRVPDHGKLAPWRFIVYQGDVRTQIGEQLLEIAMRSRELSEQEQAIEQERLVRAPVVIAVISTAAPHPKIPEWEQVLSAGIACYNVFLAANASGFAANWLTEWYAYDEAAHPVLGVKPGEKVIGFVHIGSADFAPPDRPRPELADVVTWMS